MYNLYVTVTVSAWMVELLNKCMSFIFLAVMFTQDPRQLPATMLLEECLLLDKLVLSLYSNE